ncbi:hypothetical protein D3C78_20140 [compost metagenome]
MLTVNDAIDSDGCTFNVMVYHDRHTGTGSLVVCRIIHGQGYDKDFEIRELHSKVETAEERALAYSRAIQAMDECAQIANEFLI